VSDEGLIPLEDDEPAQPVAEAPAEPAEPPAEQPDTPDQPTEAPKPAEVEAVEVGGQKYVSLAALMAERQKRQELQPLAQKAQELEGFVNENRAYIEFLKANPDFLRRPPVQEAPKAQEAPKDDPAALELARSLDLYDANGNPDVARAAKIKSVMAATAEERAKQLVQPFEQQQTQARAVHNYQAVVRAAQDAGVGKEIVDFLWTESMKQADGMRVWADEGNARSMALLAIGANTAYQQRQPKKPAAPELPPPVVTEASGGNPRTRPVLSGLEARVAKERGVSESAWAKNLEGFKPGTQNVLED
jgi:hypothetical protein